MFYTGGQLVRAGANFLSIIAVKDAEMLIKTHFIFMFAVEIGQVAEWLGRGLQNLLQRFESALDLREAQKPHSCKGNGVFAFMLDA